jgi:hypothetical protein
MAKLKVKAESYPERCEICHQTDSFDPVANHCHRCSTIIPQVDGSIQVNYNSSNSKNYNDPFVHPAMVPAGLLLLADIFIPIRLMFLSLSTSFYITKLPSISIWLPVCVIFMLLYIYYLVLLNQTRRDWNIATLTENHEVHGEHEV